MTQFEYITVAMSIVLGLGISRLLDGVLPSWQLSRRYWVHVLWIVQKLANHLLLWWTLWASHNFDGWNLAWFLWTLAGPIVLYLQATALVTTSPQNVESWEEHFYKVRRWFFLGNLVLIGILLFGVVFDRGQNQFNLSVIIGLIALSAIALVGISTANRRVHGVLVVLALTIQVLGIAPILFDVQ